MKSKSGVFYICSNAKHGCRFRMLAVYHNRKMQEKEIKDLLTKGRTKKLDGFQNKTGSPYSAVVILNKDYSYRLLFDYRPRTLVWRREDTPCTKN